jgi:hypothetical protein
VSSRTGDGSDHCHKTVTLEPVLVRERNKSEGGIKNGTTHGNQIDIGEFCITEPFLKKFKKNTFLDFTPIKNEFFLNFFAGPGNVLSLLSTVFNTAFYHS